MYHFVYLLVIKSLPDFYGESDSAVKEKITDSSSSHSKGRSHRKRSRDAKEKSNYSEIVSQLKEISIAFKNQGPVDANELYEAVMTTEGFAEEMLASAFDYMIQEEKVGRAFMAKAPKLKKALVGELFHQKYVILWNNGYVFMNYV
uniref:Uncharacterized protein n=1 Tax=Fagus sylvatica TaxID=28930 RepID=A0A2N9EGH6_FAGSY